jgi:hypothetical protein
MTPNFDFNAISDEMVQKFLAQQKPKKGRRVIWNSYSQGTYIKAKHGSIGISKHQ